MHVKVSDPNRQVVSVVQVHKPEGILKEIEMKMIDFGLEQLASFRNDRLI